MICFKHIESNSAVCTTDVEIQMCNSSRHLALQTIFLHFSSLKQWMLCHGLFSFNPKHHDMGSLTLNLGSSN